MGEPRLFPDYHPQTAEGRQNGNIERRPRNAQTPQAGAEKTWHPCQTSPIHGGDLRFQPGNNGRGWWIRLRFLRTGSRRRRLTYRLLACLACQIIEQLRKAWDLLIQMLHPICWIPDFDADRRSDEHHFAARLDTQKFTKTLGDDQSSTPR